MHERRGEVAEFGTDYSGRRSRRRRLSTRGSGPPALSRICSDGPDRRAVPFSPIDEAVDLLDTPAEPWSIQPEIRVAGALDEPASGPRSRWPSVFVPMAWAKLLPLVAPTSDGPVPSC